MKALRWAPLVVIAYALGVDFFVYGVVQPLAPFSLVGISLDEELALLVGAYAVGVLIATPFFGYLGDRIGFRRPLIIGALFLAAATLVLAYATNFGLLLAGRVLEGVAAAATWTNGLAFVAAGYPARRVQAMGYAFLGSTIGSVLGPGFAGWLYHGGGYVLPFWGSLGLIVIEIALLLVVLPRATRAPRQPNVLGLLLNRSVLIPGLAIALAAAGWSVLEPIFPNHLRRVSGAGPEQIGLVLTIATAVYGLSAPLVARVVARTGMMWAMVIGLIAMAVTLPPIALLSSLWANAIALSLASVAYALLLNPTSASLGDAVERRGVGGYAAVYAVANIAYSLGTIGTSTLATTLLAHMNFLFVLLGTSAVFILAIPLVLLVHPLAPRRAPPLEAVPHP